MGDVTYLDQSEFDVMTFAECLSMMPGHCQS